MSSAKRERMCRLQLISERGNNTTKGKKRSAPSFLPKSVFGNSVWTERELREGDNVNV